jgi:hypothetical protein
LNQELALKTLSSIMRWPDDHARSEFAWLRLMARVKYDDYRDFLAGVRFIESLAKWLQQFDHTERESAYRFVRRQLVYIGAAEMQRLVESFYPVVVQNHLLRRVAGELGIPKYKVWSSSGGSAAFERLRRKTLFMGLSDGARIDVLRHTNVGTISNEQVALSTQLDSDKWRDLLKKLRKDLGEKEARFAIVYLIDDFMGTGTSFLRFNDEKQEWSGKLARFRDSVQLAIRDLADDAPLDREWELCAHHYLATYKAATEVRARANEAASALQPELSFASIRLSFGLVLPETLPIDMAAIENADVIALTTKYYDPVLRTEHTDVGGVTHLGLGYGGCALPLVLEHNTPNNSIALLWAETKGNKDASGVGVPAMRPLFRRRQRHG